MAREPFMDWLANEFDWARESIARELVEHGWFGREITPHHADQPFEHGLDNQERSIWGDAPDHGLDHEQQHLRERGR